MYGNGLGHSKKRRTPKFSSVQTYRLTDNRVKRLYTKEINPENFEAFILFVSRNNRRIFKYKKRIINVLFENSLRYNLDPVTLLSLLAHESKYKWWKKGGVGELGLGQVRPSIWLHKRNENNLHKAGIVQRSKPFQLKYIGKGIHSTAHILVVYRKLCQKWNRRGQLRWRGYRTVNECMIRRYNGSNKKDTYKYFVNVTSYIGRYYYFIQKKEAPDSGLFRIVSN